MPEEVQAFQALIPAGTPKSAPVVINVQMPPRVIRRIEWKIPPGPSGLMGFQIGMAGTQLLPYTRGAFIVTDDESDGWDLNGLPSSGAWQVIGYNTGIFDHTVYLRFLVDIPVQDSGPGLLAPLSNDALSSPAA